MKTFSFAQAFQAALIAATTSRKPFRIAQAHEMDRVVETRRNSVGCQGNLGRLKRRRSASLERFRATVIAGNISTLVSHRHAPET